MIEHLYNLQKITLPHGESNVETSQNLARKHWRTWHAHTKLSTEKSTTFSATHALCSIEKKKRAGRGHSRGVAARRAGSRLVARRTYIVGPLQRAAAAPINQPRAIAGRRAAPYLARRTPGTRSRALGVPCSRDYVRSWGCTLLRTRLRCSGFERWIRAVCVTIPRGNVWLRMLHSLASG